MKIEEKIKIIEQYIEAYNSFNLNGMLELLDEEIEFKNYSNGEVNAETKGLNEFKELAEKSSKIFIQRQQTIRDIDTKNERITVNIDYYGILAMDLPNGLKTGQKVELTGRSVFVIKDAKILIIEDHS